MFDFPTTPAIGTVSNGYVWDGQGWRYQTPAPLSKTARSKNFVVNPTCQISQENGNTAGSTNGYYPADQWVLSFSGFSASISRSQALVSPDGSPNVLSQWFTVARASPAASDLCQIYQPIEGQRAAELEWGTAKAIPAVLRFNACCQTAGTYTVSVITTDYSWCGAFTCDGTTTFKTYVFAIPAQQSGTWPKDNTIGLSVRFCYAAGSTYTGVAGWQSGVKLSISGSTNGAATINSSLIVTDVGLYPDPDNTGVPPPWITPKLEDDLAACYRYFQWVAIQCWGQQTNGVNNLGLGKISGAMRTSPSLGVAINITNSSFSATVGAFSVFNVLGGGISENRQATATASGGFQTVVAANARM